MRLLKAQELIYHRGHAGWRRCRQRRRCARRGGVCGFGQGVSARFLLGS